MRSHTLSKPKTLLHSKRPVLFSLAILLLLPLYAQADDKADALVHRSLEAMGGADAWDETRFVSFNFGGFRTHHWDRHQNRHRLEGQNREGDIYTVLLNLDTKAGSAWMNGEKAEGDKAKEMLEMAWGAWVNDTYWLVMPYKLKDPGVNLAYDGKETLGEVNYDKVKLTFDGVGLTPGDTYWVYFNPDNGLVEHWSYVLESFEEGRAPTAWSWSGWQKFGDVMLPTEHDQAGSDRQLPMKDVAVYSSLPDSVFESSEPIATAGTNP